MGMLDKIQSSVSAKRYLKVLLSGDDGAGKTTSVIFGAEGPILVIDPERKSTDYKHLAKFDIFDSQDVQEILQLTQELLALQESGRDLPYTTILLDSATVLYKYCIDYAIEKIKIEEGQPDKYKLEPLEYQFAQKIFYDIINNLKKLNCHIFVTAHVKDNYLRNSMFKLDPNEPKKADVEKRLPYEMSLHLMLKRVGRDRFRAERIRSNLLDKSKNHLIPPVIDNFDNNTLIKMVMDFANSDQGFEEENSEVKNVIRTNAKLTDLVDQIIANVQALQLSHEEATARLKEVTGKINPYELTVEEAQKALSYFQKLNQGSTGE